MGLILELTRNIGRENARMHAGEPLQKFVGMEIEGRTLGVLGLGKLGTKVSKLAQAFGMNVIAWSPNLTPERCKEVGVGYVSKEELFSTADIITIHVVLSPRSRGLVGPADLRADEADRLHRQHRARADHRRGGVVEGIAAAQDRGRRRSTSIRSSRCRSIIPFRKLDNVVLTPHLGYVTGDSFRNHYSQMVEGIDAWFKGEPKQRLA